MNRKNALVKTARNFLSVGILFLCAASVALAQAGRGSISGLVTDPAGALVPGAKVVLLNPATGVTQHTVTSSGGLYTFISLNPGVYQVTASQKGFKNVAQEKVTVTVDQVTEVNLTLEVGAITETVTVTAGTALVEPSNSTVGQFIESPTIDRVPLLYRNVYDLVQLSAGVIPVNGSPNSSDSMATSVLRTSRAGDRELTFPRTRSTAPSWDRSTSCSMAARSELRKIIPPPLSRR